eukprot:TRINITY_DN18734_c0_g1_i1.p1 TRINITY_DN18734_c0_g1~~TRINITY_DN18734_c0_g1_i1.p1  ORF type:complete len:376 (+),score=70.86 TRINITY_DN18734_c0_g1_i1:60-1130(+)
MRQRKGPDAENGTEDAAHTAGSQSAGDGAGVEKDTTAALGPCFEVKSLPGKGLGLVAVRELRCGDLVLCEAPLLTYLDCDVWEHIARERFKELPQESQDALMQLEDVFLREATGEEKSLPGILRTNSLSRGMSSDGLVCKTISRMNHSCSPNCDWSWDEDAHEASVFASHDIAAGEELCIHYVELRATRSERQKMLRELYRFDCCCRACGADNVVESDDRRAQMRRLLAQVEELTSQHAERGIRLVCELLELYNEEGIRLRSFRKRACYVAYQFSLALNDNNGTDWWVNRAYEHSLLCHGPRHEQTLRLRGYREDPRSHPAAGRMHPLMLLSLVALTGVTLWMVYTWTLSLWDMLG